MKRAMTIATLMIVVVMAVGCGATTTLSARPDASTPATSVAASPRTAPLFSRRIMDGEVTGVNAANGDVALSTPAGMMTLHFPPSSLGNVKVGDRVTVEVEPANIP